MKLGILMMTMIAGFSHPGFAGDPVVLLHGLARSPQSMAKLAERLEAEGFPVHNIGYASTDYPIEELARQVRKEVLTATEGARRIHFVTHSMGGILVRRIQQSDPIPNLGRVVMLAPPNHGSEVVDRIGDWRLFRKINGPAGNQLGTKAAGFVAQLGPIDFECGVLTGDRSINWINSMMIPGPDDGKVSLESAKLEGLADFKILHATHPFIMRKRKTATETIHFLRTVRFVEEGESEE